MRDPKTRAVFEPSNPRTALQEVVPLKTPYMIFIDPCGACNFACNFCPCNNTNYRNKDRHTIMSMDLFSKIVEDLKEFEDPIRVVSLHALGEPLMNNHFCEMVRLLKKEKVCNEVRAFTNGSLLSPELNTELANSGLDLLKISIESLYEVDYREKHGVNINIEKLRENISDLYYKCRGGGLRITVKIVNLGLKTEKDVDSFFDLYESISDYHYIENVENRWSNFKIKEQPSIFTNAFGYTDEEERRICSKCLWLMAIQSNGGVTPCATDWKQANLLGNVKDMSVKQIWESDALYNFRILQLQREWEKLPFCNECGYWKSDNVEAYSKLIQKKLFKV